MASNLKSTPGSFRRVVLLALLVTVCFGTTTSQERSASRPRAVANISANAESNLKNTWRLPPNAVDQLVSYPSAEVAFICGPQLKSNSPLNPFSWFDKTANEMGRRHGEAAPSVAPYGPMTLDKPDNVWRNVIAGRVSVVKGRAIVTGQGTRFTLDLDPSGPAPGFNGHFRIRDAAGTERIVKVRSVESDTSLTLAAPWSYASINEAVADTFYHERDFGTNVDHYYSANYYDTALVEYINYYRTGDKRFLDYARKLADALWHSQYMGDGTVKFGHNNHLPPRSMALAGLMLRALDGRPEMWDYLERETRSTFDLWVYNHRNDNKLFSDLREGGYAQLYAVMMARVLPDTYPLYGNGTLKPRSGAATDGAAKRAAYLTHTEDTAINYFGRLQRPDGSWRWNVDVASNVEQPFMVGLYLESTILLHQLTQKPAVKAKLRDQIVNSVRHLYRDAFRGSEIVSDLPQYRWRAFWYFWGDRRVSDPDYKLVEIDRRTNGDAGNIRYIRHLNSTIHHAFGYAFLITGDREFLRMGDDVFDASYGDRVDGIHSLADSWKAKDYDMNFRASGRYLVWRLAQPAATR